MWICVDAENETLIFSATSAARYNRVCARYRFFIKAAGRTVSEKRVACSRTIGENDRRARCDRETSKLPFEVGQSA